MVNLKGKRQQDLGGCDHARDLGRLPCRTAGRGIDATRFTLLGDGRGWRGRHGRTQKGMYPPIQSHRPAKSIDSRAMGTPALA